MNKNKILMLEKIWKTIFLSSSQDPRKFPKQISHNFLNKQPFSKKNHKVNFIQIITSILRSFQLICKKKNESLRERKKEAKKR